MSEPSPRWGVVVKVAVEAATEAEARAIVDLVIDTMEIATDSPPPFVQFDDGTWATEIHVDEPTFEDVGSNNALSVLSSVKANLGPVSWRGVTDTPFDPDSARAAQLEWPPSYWALAGRKEMVVHPAVRAMLLQAREIRDRGIDGTAPDFPAWLLTSQARIVHSRSLLPVCSLSGYSSMSLVSASFWHAAGTGHASRCGLPARDERPTSAAHERSLRLVWREAASEAGKLAPCAWPRARAACGGT